jgi:hypothetical protein
MQSILQCPPFYRNFPRIYHLYRLNHGIEENINQYLFQTMSRLDRLFTLLSSSGKGSGSAILAANQLGEVQKSNNSPKQLEQLLERLHPLLR